MFNKLRTFLWPIQRHELKKLLPLLLMSFLLTFNLNILRTLKESLIVTAPFSGAEVIPFLKLWVVLPMAFLLTLLFAKLSNHLSREKLFYTLLGLFLGSYALFTFVLYPLRDLLHPHQAADFLQTHLPTGCQGLIAMFRYWTFSLFYCMAELWGTTIVLHLFWGFVNQVVQVEEAKRLYSLLGLGAHLAGIPAGLLSYWLSSLSLGPAAWQQTLHALTLTILLSGLLALLLFRWFNRHVAEGQGQAAPVPFRMSLKESFRTLSHSRYLICLALIVLAYSLVTDLTQVLWKDQVKRLYPDPASFNAYLSKVTTWTGLLATFFALFITSNVIRKWGWTFTALLCPTLLLLSSAGFFLFFFFHEKFSSLALFLNSTPLTLIVFFGALQTILGSASKYSFFDTTKELAFIPLSSESKIKGKALIDGVGMQVGKSSGMVLHQGLIIAFTSVAQAAPYTLLLLGGCMVTWIVAVKLLGKEFSSLTTRKAEKAA